MITSAAGREEKGMNGLPVIPEKSDRKPDHTKTARLLLAACREFYQDKENERTYMEWKNGRNEKEAV